MKRIIQWLIPKEKKLFEMLTEQSENTLEAAKELKNFVSNYDKFERSERKAKAQIIKNIKHKGDEITHNMFGRLNKISRIQIDKEHISQIVVLLDDIIEFINAVALRFVILSIERIDEYIPKLVDITLDAVSEVNKGISDLRKLNDIEDHYPKIYKLESEADDIYNDALSELFHFYKNSIDIMKYKEIYELLESTVDKCKDIANIFENIAVKHM